MLNTSRGLARYSGAAGNSEGPWVLIVPSGLHCRCQLRPRPLPRGPAHRVLYKRRDGSGRRLYVELASDYLVESLNHEIKFLIGQFRDLLPEPFS